MGELQASPLCARAATRAAEVVDARLAQATDELCDPRRAVKQGRKTEFQMQRAQLELHQVRKHPRAQRVALPNQLGQPRQEF